MVVLKELFESCLDILQRQFSIYRAYFGHSLVVQLLVVDKNGFGLMVESHQSFGDDFLSVVQAATCLSSVQQSFNHYLISNFDVKEENDFDLVADNLFPRVDVILIPWKAINHHDFLTTQCKDLFLELLHNNLTRHHLSFLHFLADLVGLFCSSFQVFSEDVANRDMGEIVAFSEEIAVRSLARTWAA